MLIVRMELRALYRSAIMGVGFEMMGAVLVGNAGPKATGAKLPLNGNK